MDNTTQQPNKANDWLYGAVAEIAFFAFLYYAQVLLKVDGNLLLNSFILWALLNISITLCPVFRKCCK